MTQSKETDLIARIEQLVPHLLWLLEGILGVLPSGQVKRVPPGDPPFRDMLLGLAAYELAQNIEDAQERSELQKASLNIVSNIPQKTLNRI
jgi:hypothetical protein